MSKEIIKDETGTYMVIPRDKIKFVSKEAEIIFDLSTENDYLQQKNNALKEKFRATNKGLQKVLLRSKKWKHRYELAKHEIKELKTQNEFLMKRDNKCQILEQQYCERTDCSARLGTSKKVEALEKKNEELKKQLEYLRSGEYLNQLKFERDMLQHVVENSEVSKEDKEFIDMTHRNTELLKENEELKKQLKGTTHCFDEEEHERLKKQLEECIATNEVLSHELTEDKILKQDHLTTCYGIPIGDIPRLINQQKVFIEYLEDEIERLPGLTTWFYRNAKGKLIGHTEIVQGAYKEILQKYKEIVNGGKKE